MTVITAAAPAASTDRPGYITRFNADGSVSGWVPDYGQPGVAERVAADVLNDYYAARPVRSSVGQIQRFRAIANGKRF